MVNKSKISKRKHTQKTHKSIIKSKKNKANKLSHKVKASIRSIFNIKSKNTKSKSIKSKNIKSKNIKSKSIKSKNIKSKNTKSKNNMKGGSNCDEYAFVNEYALDIPTYKGVPGLKIPAKRASIGQVKSCPTINHP